jgi:hypothetical protein
MHYQTVFFNFLVSLPVNPPSTENPTGSDATSGSGDPTTPDDNEQYRRKNFLSEYRIFNKSIGKYFQVYQ